MAKQEKEQTIFELLVEPKQAFTELEKYKKAILDTKQEQKLLNDALKKGHITQKEFVSESVRLEAALKRHQSAYNNVQKSVTGVKTQLDKLIDSNKKISKSFEETASQINVAGVNVGSLTSRLSAFANPATAAIGIAGGLFAAYQRSTIGAKDLEFAQNQLNAAITIGTNAFANLFSSAEDGQGFFSKLLGGLLFQLDPTTGTLSRLAAFNLEKLEELQRNELQVRDVSNQRLSENQELLTEIQSEQTKYNDKLNKADIIIANLYRNEVELKTVLEDELKVLQDQLAIDSENDAIQTSILQKKTEISNVERDTEKRVQAIVRLQQNLIEAENKRADTIRRNLSLADKSLEGKLSQSSIGEAAQSTKQDPVQDTSIVSGTLAVVDSQKVAADAIKDITKGIIKNNQDQANSYKKKSEVAKTAAEAEVKAQEAIQVAIQQAASIFGENTVAYKFLATADAIMNTYKGANIALGTYPPPFSYIAAAATVAAGLANVANINSVDLGGAAAGGGNFLTKGPTMLMVGDNPGGVERVTVEPISGKGQTKVWGENLMAFGGGGSITTAGDGGLFRNTSALQADQNLAMVNAIKMMPAPVVSVKEINKVSKRVQVKESTSRIGIKNASQNK